MRQRIVHGAFVDMVTPDELYRALPRPRQKTRMRVPMAFKLDAAGVLSNGEIYKCPIGHQFEVRRIVVVLSGNNANSDPSSGPILLNAAGKWAAYLRSGQLLEYAGLSYGSSLQIPGSQTWGDEQGPYIQNGETFGLFLNAGIGVANTELSAYLEGILTRPGDKQDA